MRFDPALLEANASTLVGTPFRHRARGPDALDCYGLLITLYRQTFGIDLAEKHADGSRAHRARASALVMQEAATWVPITPGQERPGDVIILRRHGRPLHLGVVLSDRRMVHADHPSGVSSPRYDSAEWVNLIIGFYRHPLLA